MTGIEFLFFQQICDKILPPGVTIQQFLIENEEKALPSILCDKSSERDDKTANQDEKYGGHDEKCGAINDDKSSCQKEATMESGDVSGNGKPWDANGGVPKTSPPETAILQVSKY